MTDSQPQTVLGESNTATILRTILLALDSDLYILCAALIILSLAEIVRQVLIKRAIRRQVFCSLQTTMHHVLQAQNLHSDHFDAPAVMNASLLLVSRILSTDELLPYFYTAFFSPVEEVDAPEGQRHFVYTDVPTRLTRKQARKTKRRLRRFAKEVRILLTSNSIKADSTEKGHCVYLPSQPDLGVAIHVSASYYELLKDSRLSDQDRAWIHVALAETIIHELAHAAVFVARAPHDGDYYFFPDCALAEDGFQCTNLIFGGQLVFLMQDLRNALEMTSSIRRLFKGVVDVVCGRKLEPLVLAGIAAWPNASCANHYRDMASKIGVRGVVPPDEGVSRLPVSSALVLFDEAWWERSSGGGWKAVMF